MEGAGGEIVSGRHSGGLKGCLVAVSLAGLAQAWAGRGSDEFLIVERPARLVVLNRYQQNLTPNELTLLQPFVPMKILRSRDLLGDGFTPCTRVEIGGTEFFLIREDAGLLAGETHAGALTTTAGFSHPWDTVHVLRNGGLRFSAPSGQGESFLAAGERIVRIFTHSGRTYVKRSGGARVYGWVNLAPDAEGRLWSLSHLVPTAESTIPVRIRDSVQAALSRTNALLVNLYAYFNGTSRQHRATPRWQMEPEGTVLRCTLLDGSPERDFAESTRYLVRELENHVLGTDFGVFQYPRGIEIRPK
jgi:hypothetical protein